MEKNNQTEMNEWERGFTCGVAWVCALIAKNGQLAADQIWKESNMPEEDLAVVDPKDAAIVKAALRGEDYWSKKRWS